jgi:AcrR family transcriptional regulator
VKRDPEGTRKRILAAALKEFAAKGPAGARVDEIARLAGVNKRMLYHYFGSKEDLYREVYRRKLQEKTQTAAEQPSDLLESLPYWFEDMLRDPDWVRLLGWQALSEGSKGAVADEERGTLYAQSLAWVRDAQADGSVPRDLDPDLFLLAALAMNIFPIAFPQITRDVVGTDLADPELRVRFSAFLRALGRHLRDDPAEETETPAGRT